MRVLRCVGTPTEATLAFAGLLQMLRPILGLIERLPGPQAAALQGVFGLSNDPVEDRFLISVGVLSLLSEAAEEVPLLCVVDDVRWLDHESSDVLAFVARIEAEAIAFVVALAEEDALHFAVSKPRRVRLSSPRRRTPAPSCGTPARRRLARGRRRIVRTAHGVPLLLTELVSSLSPDQLEGRAPLPDALPVSPDVEALYLGRVRALPESSQTALLVAAATRLEDLSTIAAALRFMDLGEEALDEAAGAGLVDVSGSRHVRPSRHPPGRLWGLVADRPPTRLRRAGIRPGRGRRRVDPRVWHRALASIAPDEDVADELERSADRSAARSGCATAATALERAAELSGDETARARRLARAAEMAWLGGQADRAMVLAAEAEAWDAGVVNQARIDFVRAAWGGPAGRHERRHPRLCSAALRPLAILDPSVALRMLLAGMMVMSLTGRQASTADMENLERLADGRPPTPCEARSSSSRSTSGWPRERRRPRPARGPCLVGDRRSRRPRARPLRHPDGRLPRGSGRREHQRRTGRYAAPERVSRSGCFRSVCASSRGWSSGRAGSTTRGSTPLRGSAWVSRRGTRTSSWLTTGSWPRSRPSAARSGPAGTRRRPRCSAPSIAATATP